MLQQTVDARTRVPAAEATPLPVFEKMTLRMFAETDVPLPRGDAYARLQEMGVVVPGVEPPNTMTTRFSRMNEITNLKGHGYWLKSRPYPPAGYEANLADRLYADPEVNREDDLAEIVEAVTREDSA